MRLKMVLIFAMILISLSGSIQQGAAVSRGGSSLYLPLIITPFDTFYVSKSGNNTVGTSWQTAWNELDQIDWSQIKPGNTILIDGGESGVIYNTTLNINGISGGDSNPITIKLATETGRNGQAVIFGGRSLPLPYCDQTEYTFQEADVNQYGIYLDEVNHLVIDGSKRSGIVIYGHNNNGIRFNANTSHITVRNLEIYDNGSAENDGSGWRTDAAGIRIAGPDLLFENMIIHDNGQDAFQAGSGFSSDFNLNNLDNLTIRRSWLYNGRKHPTVNESFNYCSHTDGLQIHRGGEVRNIVIEESIIGPGFTNNLLLGQSLTPSGAQATVHDVTIRNSLFTKAADNSIRGYDDTFSTGWLIDQVTSHCPQTKGHCLFLTGGEHSVIDSIIVNAAVTFPDGLDHASGNCQWETSGGIIGEWADPQFIDASDDMFSLDNYGLDPESACLGKGSSITTVNQLLELMDN